MNLGSLRAPRVGARKGWSGATSPSKARARCSGECRSKSRPLRQTSLLPSHFVRGELRLASPLGEIIIKQHVYILRSIDNPDKIYVGYTNNIDRRLEEHNSGSQIYSKRYAPWELITYLTFTDKTIASQFEKYLKTPSGKAFINKHLIQKF